MTLAAEMNMVIVQVEGMKAANSQHPEDQPFTKQEFDCKVDQLSGIAQALNTLGY